MYFVLLKYEINTQGVNFPKNAKSKINDQAVYKAKKINKTSKRQRCIFVLSERPVQETAIAFSEKIMPV